jgi:hypothetical protein
VRIGSRQIHGELVPSAGGTAEPHGGAGDIVQHLERLQLDVADDPHRPVVAAGGEGEAVGEEDPRRVELHGGAVVEHQRDLRQRDAADAPEVVAGVELVLGRRRAVHPHPGPEGGAQRAVRRRREARDHRPGVHDGAGREHRRRHGEGLTGDDDGLEADEVQHRRLPDAEHGRQDVPGGGDPGHAEDEEAAVARRPREAVGEDAAVGEPGLRHKRLRAAAERHDPGGVVGEVALHGVTAPELEPADHRRGVQPQHVGDVGAHGGPPVGVLDAVLALPGPGGAAVAVGAELPADGRAAGERRVRRRLGGVVEDVRLGVALRHGAGGALDPRHVAGGVEHHRLLHARQPLPAAAAGRRFEDGHRLGALVALHDCIIIKQ